MPAHDVDAISSRADSAGQPRRAFWPEGWRRLIDFRIGIVPLPIYVLLIGLIAALVAVGEIKSDGPTMIVDAGLGKRSTQKGHIEPRFRRPPERDKSQGISAAFS
jgi:hypothetical protein